jgi:hypothetical protein
MQEPPHRTDQPIVDASPKAMLISFAKTEGVPAATRTLAFTLVVTAAVLVHQAHGMAAAIGLASLIHLTFECLWAWRNRSIKQLNDQLQKIVEKLGQQSRDVSAYIESSTKREREMLQSLSGSAQSSADSLASASRTASQYTEIHASILGLVDDHHIVECVKNHLRQFWMPRESYCELLAKSLHHSKSWLGVHQEQIAFFLEPSPSRSKQRYVDELSKEVGSLRVRVLLRREGESNGLDDVEQLRRYRDRSRGVRSIIARNYVEFEREFLPNAHPGAPFRDLALYDTSLVLEYVQYDKGKDDRENGLVVVHHKGDVLLNKMTVLLSIIKAEESADFEVRFETLDQRIQFLERTKP